MFVNATLPDGPTLQIVRGCALLLNAGCENKRGSGHADPSWPSEREGVKRIMERTAIEYRAESRILVLSAERLTNRADSEAQYLAASAAARMANLLERGFSIEQAQALAMGEEIQS